MICYLNITELCFLFNFLINLEIGFTRFVFLVLRACALLVRLRVTFIRCALAKSNGLPQSLASGTVRFALNPEVQRHANLGPFLVLFHTIRCSLIPSVISLIFIIQLPSTMAENHL